MKCYSIFLQHHTLKLSTVFSLFDPNISCCTHVCLPVSQSVFQIHSSVETDSSHGVVVNIDDEGDTVTNSHDCDPDELHGVRGWIFSLFPTLSLH